MNKNIIIYIAIVTLAAIPTVSFAAPSVDNPGVGTPLTTSNTGSTVPPATSNPGSTVPASGGSSNVGGSSSSGSYRGSYSSGGGYAYVNNCQPLITSYMKLGANNDFSQVLKLQNFLKNTEKLNVDANGVFDAKTDTAVRAFQNKYFSVVLAPWDANQSSGYVYITTSKKINQIVCNQSIMTLNPSELAVIDAFKNRAPQTNTNGIATTVLDPENASTSIQINNDNTVGATGDQSQNTASVNKASILERFWNFLVFLFR